MHVRVYGAPATSAARDEAEFQRLLETRVGAVSDPIDVLAEVRRTIALMDPAAQPRTLLLVGRRGMSGAARLAETIAAAPNAGEKGVLWWTMCVVIIIMIVPVILMALLLQRFIARGVLLGAVKG